MKFLDIHAKDIPSIIWGLILFVLLMCLAYICIFLDQADTKWKLWYYTKMGIPFIKQYGKSGLYLIRMDK